MSSKGDKLYRITWWAYNYIYDCYDDFEETISATTRSKAIHFFNKLYPLARHIEIEELEDLELK